MAGTDAYNSFRPVRRMMEIPLERFEEIERKADYLHHKYNLPFSPQAEDLKRIAVQEFGVVKIVKSPLLRPRIVEQYDDFYVFYRAFCKSYERIVLGNILGCFALGHLENDSAGISRIMQEQQEADYFSAYLNNISLAYLNDVKWDEAFASLNPLTLAAHRFHKGRHIENLKQQGVHHLIR